MVQLLSSDKTKLEALFEMKSGYVLDVSNNSFASFFRENYDIDIYSGDYEFYGESKANHLRAFWEKADSATVGKTMLCLLEHWRTERLVNKKEITIIDQLLYDECQTIAKRLGGNVITQPNHERSSYFPDNTFALFISHCDKDKVLAKNIKNYMVKYGVSSFVAHEDINPSAEWINEIENALFSMDTMLALLTDGFSNSVWTNQEVGFAYGRNIFILSVRLGEDPSGFVGKFQALRPKSNSAENIAKQIVVHLLGHKRTTTKMQKSYFHALANTSTFAESEKWAEILPHIAVSTKEATDILISSYNDNPQAYDCYDLNGGSYGNYSNIADKINDWLSVSNYKLVRKKIVKI